MQVVDLCAGAGGKTLALAAAMDNRGQIFATDTDKRRLAPIFERLTRAGARNVQVRTPKGAGRRAAGAICGGKADLVLVDAPCTGTGTWRRNPDAKWRVRPDEPGRPDRRTGGGARPGRAAGEAGRPHRLHHLLACCRRRTTRRWRPSCGADSGFKVIPPEKVAADAGLPELAAFATAYAATACS